MIVSFSSSELESQVSTVSDLATISRELERRSEQVARGFPQNTLEIAHSRESLVDSSSLQPPYQKPNGNFNGRRTVPPWFKTLTDTPAHSPIT